MKKILLGLFIYLFFYNNSIATVLDYALLPNNELFLHYSYGPCCNNVNISSWTDLIINGTWIDVGQYSTFADTNTDAFVFVNLNNFANDTIFFVCFETNGYCSSSTGFSTSCDNNYCENIALAAFDSTLVLTLNSSSNFNYNFINNEDIEVDISTLHRYIFSNRFSIIN